VLSEPRAADGCRSASGSDRLGKTRGAHPAPDSVDPALAVT